MVWNILWSDPIEDDQQADQRGVFGVHPSPRSSTGLFKFGWNVTKTFCAANGLGLIIRSHQSKEGSLGFSLMHDRMLIRVFSARDYEEHGNDGAVILVSELHPSMIGSWEVDEAKLIGTAHASKKPKVLPQCSLCSCPIDLGKLRYTHIALSGDRLVLDVRCAVRAVEEGKCAPFNKMNTRIIRLGRDHCAEVQALYADAAAATPATPIGVAPVALVGDATPAVDVEKPSEKKVARKKKSPTKNADDKNDVDKKLGEGAAKNTKLVDKVADKGAAEPLTAAEKKAAKKKPTVKKTRKADDAKMEAPEVEQKTLEEDMTFENSSFKTCLDNTEHPEFDSDVQKSVQAFLQSPEIAKTDPTATDECKQLYKKLHKTYQQRLHHELKNAPPGKDDLEALSPEVVAEVMWTSAATAKFLGKPREFCWLVNWCIRLDNVVLLALLMPFIKALNRFSAPVRSGPLPRVPWNLLKDWTLYRGGGFNMQFKDFFMSGKQFRVPGFWATTPTQKISDSFIERAFHAGFEPIRWIIKIDPVAHCWHVNFISRSLIHNIEGKPMEDEFLFSQFSVFTVSKAVWQSTPTPSCPHEVHLKALPDNRHGAPKLKLAPWN
jgi:hypothetical protein